MLGNVKRRAGQQSRLVIRKLVDDERVYFVSTLFDNDNVEEFTTIYFVLLVKFAHFSNSNSVVFPNFPVWFVYIIKTCRFLRGESRVDNVPLKIKQ